MKEFWKEFDEEPVFRAIVCGGVSLLVWLLLGFAIVELFEISGWGAILFLSALSSFLFGAFAYDNLPIYTWTTRRPSIGQGFALTLIIVIAILFIVGALAVIAALGPRATIGERLFVGLLVMAVMMAALFTVNFAIPDQLTPHEFRVALKERLGAAISERSYNVPNAELWERLISIADGLYSTPWKKPEILKQSRPEAYPEEWDRFKALWKRVNDIAFEAIFQSTVAFVSKLPDFSKNAPFSKPLIEIVNAPNLTFEMMQPFRESDVRDLQLFQTLVARYNSNVGVISEAGQPLIQPQRYDGPKEAMAQAYFGGLPFLPLLQTLVPYQPFTDEMRFAHHWCMGKTGRGKTTFLRHLIKDDLDRTAKSECSLVVVDSKKLIREMRTLKMFAAGEPLDKRVTIIDSDVPFPLNPFYLPPAQARAVLIYMLANMSEASGLQTGALAFLIDAAMKHDKPSLRTIRDFFKLDARKGELPAEWSRYDQDTKDWFKHTFKNLHAATREGLHQRLANFIKGYPNLNRMFEADSFGIDVEALHNGGCVLLVDTDLGTNGEDGTNLLGRLVIALMEQLSTRRNKLDEKSLKPLWFYMDEAADYIKGDHKFVQILTKARSSRVGVTVAYQFLGQIESPPVEKALENAEIHSVCTQRGTVELTIAENSSILPVRPLEFSEIPQMQMTREEYRAFREAMALAHPYKHVPPPTGDDDQPLTQKFP
jgi:hypothetical protein